MNKTLQMDFGKQRLLSLASQMVEQHNLIGALRILNKNAELNGNDEYSYMLYAEIFDDMQLFEKCVNYWFKFLDVNKNCDVAEAYEGLAVAFMNMGQEHFAAYYYNQLMLETDDLSPETRREILQSFMPPKQSPLKIVYPPKLADYSQQIEKGVDYMRINEFEKAVDCFEEVEEGNDKYLSARNYIAMCKIISDKCEEAEAECFNILKNDPDNVQALTTLAAVKTEQKNAEEGKKLAERLVKIKTDNPDDIYKIATVCCENKLHQQAYNLFGKLEDDFGYDCTLLYFKAISAYNSGDKQGSINAFNKLLTIYPNAVTARYYYEFIQDEKNKDITELSYFYRMPLKERESSLKFLAAFSSLSQKNSNTLTDLIDISDCIRWCFDEGDVREDSELQRLAASCAVKAELDDIVREILLNAFISDSLKIGVLQELCQRNEQNEFGVVFCNTYKKLYTFKLNLGRAKRKYFISAYANLFARFGVLDVFYSQKFKTCTEKLYACLEWANVLDLAKDVNALTAAIFIMAEVTEAGIDSRSAHKIFEADSERTNYILSFADIIE